MNIKRLLIPSSIILLLVTVAGYAYPHRAKLFPRLAMKLAVVHMEGVTGNAPPYTLDQDETTTAGPITHDIYIKRARRFDGAEATVEWRHQVMMKATGTLRDYMKGQVDLWPTGQRIYYRDDTKTKQTYNLTIGSDTWNAKMVARPDPSANCSSTFDGSQIFASDVPVTNETITTVDKKQTFTTVKIVKNTVIGKMTAWYLPASVGCFPVQQLMEFKNGGRDLKALVHLAIGDEPDPRLFRADNFAETPPESELVLKKQIYLGRNPNKGETDEVTRNFGNPYKLHGELNHPFTPAVR